MILQLANLPKSTSADLSSLTAVSSGAAYLPPAVVESFRDKIGGHTEVAYGYGLSEVVSRCPLNL